MHHAACGSTFMIRGAGLTSRKIGRPALSDSLCGVDVSYDQRRGRWIGER